MKRIHLLRTTAAADVVAEIFAAARAEGSRIGWLDLTSAAADSATATDKARGGSSGSIGELERAAADGALRAVSFAGGRSVAVKRVAGEPTLRDLLREHFLGCVAVLVHVPPGGAPPSVAGAEDLPLLDPADPPGDHWRIVPPDSSPRSEAVRLTAAELVARLRRPRPWGEIADRSD